jgi:hypothetical protein
MTNAPSVTEFRNREGEIEMKFVKLLLVARTSDKVQVMRTVGAMQFAGHDKELSCRQHVPALAKNRKDGAPTVP